MSITLPCVTQRPSLGTGQVLVLITEWRGGTPPLEVLDAGPQVGGAPAARGAGDAPLPDVLNHRNVLAEIGTRLKSFAAQSTGSSNRWQDVTIPAPATTDSMGLFLVFKGGANFRLNFFEVNGKGLSPETRPTVKITMADDPRGVAASIVDGLAFGVMPEAAARLKQSHPLVALVHHPLAMESSIPADDAAPARLAELQAVLEKHPQPDPRKRTAGWEGRPARDGRSRCPGPTAP